MLVGSDSIDFNRLKAMTSAEQLSDFAVELVPPLFRHVKEIVDNQKYLIALNVRKMYKDDYNKWHPLCEELLADVRVTGGIHSICTCQDLLHECDTKILSKFLQKEG